MGTLSYQWFANGESIVGATDEAFILTGSEVGKEITVGISYMDAYGKTESLVSNPTDTITNNTFYFGGDGDGIFPNLDNAPIFDFSNVSQIYKLLQVKPQHWFLGLALEGSDRIRRQSFSLLFCRTPVWERDYIRDIKEVSASDLSIQWRHFGYKF